MKYSGKYKIAQAADKAGRERYLSGAIANTDRSLKLNPGDYRATIMKAMFLYVRGDLNESLFHFQRGLNLAKKALNTPEDWTYLDSFCGYWSYRCALDLGLDQEVIAVHKTRVRNMDLKNVSYMLLTDFPASFLQDWDQRFREIEGPGLFATDYYEIVPGSLIGAAISYAIYESFWVALVGLALLLHFLSLLFYEARKSRVSVHVIWPFIPLGWIANYFLSSPSLTLNIALSLGGLVVSLIAFLVVGRARAAPKWWPLICVLFASVAWVGVLGTVVAVIIASTLAYIYVYRTAPRQDLTAIGKWAVCGYLGSSFALVWLYPLLSFGWLFS